MPCSAMREEVKKKKKRLTMPKSDPLYEAIVELVKEKRGFKTANVKSVIANQNFITVNVTKKLKDYDYYGYGSNRKRVSYGSYDVPDSVRIDWDVAHDRALLKQPKTLDEFFASINPDLERPENAEGPINYEPDGYFKRHFERVETETGYHFKEVKEWVPRKKTEPHPEKKEEEPKKKKKKRRSVIVEYLD